MPSAPPSMPAPAAPTSQIEAQLQAAECAVQDVNDRLDLLWRRLEPVLSPIEPADPGDAMTAVKDPVSPVADRLRVLELRAGLARGTIERLIAHLEV